VNQTRPRTIHAVKKAVLEFREIHGSLAAVEITRQHARIYRDHLIKKHLSDATIENRIGFLSILVRFGQIEVIKHLPSNPFESIFLYTRRKHQLNQRC
jgi:hypothetical protein